VKHLYIIAKHWSEIDRGWWDTIAPNFSPRELASKGDGSIKMLYSALVALQKLRNVYNGPLTINSGYRDPAHNLKVGGSPNSQHIEGTAFDIHITDVEMGRKLERIAKEVGYVGIGRYKTFIHVDMRPSGKAEWGSWNDTVELNA
jgi:uncharacterized protein YcbK (DUF882 family)